jgi:hypothetical protein
MKMVHVRNGEHREAYHSDAACPSLNGKQETYRGQKSILEEDARKEGLKACLRCKE